MPTTQEQVIRSVPSYLRQFVVHQDYDSYTPRNHATWRYIMRRNIDFLQDKAHPAYLDGLKQTGISVESIPRIDDMNESLSGMGWRAVVVDGFVPPAAFMEFSAHKILVISAEMRHIGNILYTPAPDIVHEAAGHAPIIADATYSRYLQLVGDYGSKAVFSKLDYEIYEAIRYLSIIKEYPHATKEEVRKAEGDLRDKIGANTEPSEANLLSRLHWWTVEYGLVGTPDNFRLFGAGLLSSVGESKACLKPAVKKIPLSADCVHYDYDITTMQPQLFVARDFNHLIGVLEDFAAGMCFRRGGAGSLRKVIQSENAGTAGLSSGLQISGVFTDVETDDRDRAIYIRTGGPTQLCHGDKELEGHGTKTHKDGFGSPLGRLRGWTKALEDFEEGDLLEARISTGSDVELAFESGITVQGRLKEMISREGKIILMSFDRCTVTAPSGPVLFQPQGGLFDMAVGEHIASAWSGTADKEQFNVYPPKSTRTAIKDDFTEEELRLFDLYRTTRRLREHNAYTHRDIGQVYSAVKDGYPREWLIRLELLELLNRTDTPMELQDRIRGDLDQLKRHSDVYEDVITAGLEFMDA
ncbi:MAG: aromatic amino acid hydroxylase [Balneolales bacterium]